MPKSKPNIDDLMREIAKNLSATARLLQEVAKLHPQAKAQTKREAAEAKAQTKLVAFFDKLKEKQLAAEAEAMDERHLAACAEAEATVVESKEALAVCGPLDEDEIIRNQRRAFGVPEGDLGSSFEWKVAELVRDKGEFCGVRLQKVREEITSYEGYHYGIIATGRKSVIPVGLRPGLWVKDVYQCARSVAVFPVIFPESTGRKRIIGAIVYRRTDREGVAITEALSCGLRVFRYDDDQNILLPIKTAKDIKKHGNPPE